jgi:hypothetical protein
MQRSMRIAVRLVLYPMALGLILLAWREYHGGSAPADPPALPGQAGWEGVTSQGQAVKAIAVNGRIDLLDTTVVEGCNDGSRFTFHWVSFQHDLVQRGDAVRRHQAGSGRSNTGRPFAFDNRVRLELGAPGHGTVRMKATLSGARGPVRCGAGPVAFTLRRSGI